MRDSDVTHSLARCKRLNYCSQTPPIKHRWTVWQCRPVSLSNSCIS